MLESHRYCGCRLVACWRVTCWRVAVAIVSVIGVVAAWIVGVVTAWVVTARSTGRSDARGRHHHGGGGAGLADSSSPDVGLLVVVGGLSGTDDLGQGACWCVLAVRIADVEASGVATGHLGDKTDRCNNKYD